MSVQSTCLVSGYQFLLTCRVELLIQCDAGTYQLGSGTNNNYTQTFTQDPGCGSSHCDVYQQPIVATVKVVSPHISFWTQEQPADGCFHLHSTCKSSNSLFVLFGFGGQQVADSLLHLRKTLCW